MRKLTWFKTHEKCYELVEASYYQIYVVYKYHRWVAYYNYWSDDPAEFIGEARTFLEAVELAENFYLTRSFLLRKKELGDVTRMPLQGAVWGRHCK